MMMVMLERVVVVVDDSACDGNRDDYDGSRNENDNDNDNHDDSDD